MQVLTVLTVLAVPTVLRRLARRPVLRGGRVGGARRVVAPAASLPRASSLIGCTSVADLGFGPRLTGHHPVWRGNALSRSCVI
jgi:hypothetical protein